MLTDQKNDKIILFREWMGSGVPSGLQNQYEELVASWVGSIPTHSRQSCLVKPITDDRLFLFEQKSKQKRAPLLFPVRLVIIQLDTN